MKNMKIMHEKIPCPEHYFFTTLQIIIIKNLQKIHAALIEK